MRSADQLSRPRGERAVVGGVVHSSPDGRRVHRGDVRRDDLPAEIREAHPRLALTADEVAAADLEFEVDGGEIAPEREDLEAPALLLAPGPPRARHAMGVDGVDAVAVLVERVADGVRA